MINFILAFNLIIFAAQVNADAVFEQVAAKHEFLFFDKQTEIKFLGSLVNGDKIYNYRHYWNGGSRVSTRIVAVDKNNELVGVYAVNDWALHLKNDCILFPYSKKEGNTICLKNGTLPRQVWLDGETPTRFK